MLTIFLLLLLFTTGTGTWRWRACEQKSSGGLWDREQTQVKHTDIHSPKGLLGTPY